MRRSNSTLALGLAAGALALGISARMFRARYSFAGKVIVITGGSRGLGLAIARELAKEGAMLALVARDKAELERARIDVRGYGARAVEIFPADVRDEAQVKYVIAQAVQHFGRIDVLLNNAGMITVGPVETMSNEDWEDAMDLHFWAPLHAVQAALPHLRRTEGRIVNIASFGGKLAVPHMAPYCASKFALVGLSDALRAELAEQGIRVTTVCPGLLRTGSHLNAFFKGAHQEEFAWFSSGMAVPGSSMAASRAARKIIEACRSGRPERVLSLKAKLAVLAQALMPNTAARVLSGINRRLPHSLGRHAGERFTGWQSRTAATAQYTGPADSATEDLNGLRGHRTAHMDGVES